MKELQEIISLYKDEAIQAAVHSFYATHKEHTREKHMHLMVPDYLSLVALISKAMVERDFIGKVRERVRVEDSEMEGLTLSTPYSSIAFLGVQKALSIPWISAALGLNELDSEEAIRKLSEDDFKSQSAAAAMFVWDVGSTFNHVHEEVLTQGRNPVEKMLADLLSRSVAGLEEEIETQLAMEEAKGATKQ